MAGMHSHGNRRGDVSPSGTLGYTWSYTWGQWERCSGADSGGTQMSEGSDVPVRRRELAGEWTAVLGIGSEG
jgi:hypothetical protein